jgi:glycosyltransferase involved in cell wall biosynthesis
VHLAVYGILADGAGSGAGSFPILLKALLERAHRIDFYGNPKFIRPTSLEGLSGYRYVPLHSPAAERLFAGGARLGSPHVETLVSQVNHLTYQRLAAKAIEAEHRHTPYDLVLQTDAQALWPSTLPVISWPQSPPQTEARTLRDPDVARLIRGTQGRARAAAVRLYYTYRQLLARAALRFSDRYICGSRWALSEWERFGAPRARLASFSYPVPLEPFADVGPPGAGETITFLWLGRATPRKRLDLFFEAFERVRRSYPRARARLVGNLEANAEVRALVERHVDPPCVVVEPPVARRDVPKLFAEVDVLVQPSQNENYGFSIAEALAAGRPVVAGPTNGTLEYAGDAGFRFDDYHADSVADAMGRALEAVIRDGPGLSRRARASARRHFSPSVVVDQFEALCRETIAEHGRRS